MKGKPVKKRDEALRKSKPKGFWEILCKRYIDEFLRSIKEGYEAYDISFEPNEKKELCSMYDSLRNIIENSNAKLPIKVVRDLKGMKIWLFVWTEKDEKQAQRPDLFRAYNIPD